MNKTTRTLQIKKIEYKAKLLFFLHWRGNSDTETYIPNIGI